MGRYLRPAVGIALSAWCLWYLFREARVSEVVAAFARARGEMIVFALGALGLAVLAKTWRWRMLLGSPRSVTFADLLSAVLVGYMVSTVVPLRLGEVARAYLVSERGALALSHSVASIVVEKVLDVATLLVVLGCVALLVPLPGWAAALAVGGALAIGVAVLGVTVLSLGARFAPHLAQWRPGWLPAGLAARLAPAVGQFLRGVGVARDPRRWPALGVWSALTWLSGVLVNYFAIQAMNVPIHPVVAAFVLVVTNLGMAAPSAPGYVGVFHFLAVQALLPFGVPESTALSAALALHGLIFAPFVLAGGALLWRRGYRPAVSWRQARAKLDPPVQR